MPVTVEWMSELCYTCTMEYCTAMTMNKTTTIFNNIGKSYKHTGKQKKPEKVYPLGVDYLKIALGCCYSPISWSGCWLYRCVNSENSSSCIPMIDVLFCIFVIQQQQQVF